MGVSRKKCSGQKGGCQASGVGLRRSSAVCNSGIANASSSVTKVIQIASVLLRAGWKAEPSSLRGGGFSGHTPHGKTKPFRKSGGRAAGHKPSPSENAETPGAVPRGGPTFELGRLTQQGFARLNFQTVSCV